MGNMERRLEDLISVGPAMLRDFARLGIRNVGQLAVKDPHKMYARMERLTGRRQDPCVLDTYCAAVAQARNPRLPAEQCQWWWCSRKRKEQSAAATRRRTKNQGREAGRARKNRTAVKPRRGRNSLR